MPRTSSDRVRVSGNCMVSASQAARATSNAQKIANAPPQKLKPNTSRLPRVSTATAASTSGYRHEMRLRQWRQRPRSRRKLKRGILSRAPMGVLHWGQCDAGRTTERWRGRRLMQTFRKLPKARPKSNAKTIWKVSIAAEGPQNSDNRLAGQYSEPDRSSL